MSPEEYSQQLLRNSSKQEAIETINNKLSSMGIKNGEKPKGWIMDYSNKSYFLHVKEYLLKENFF